MRVEKVLGIISMELDCKVDIEINKKSGRIAFTAKKDGFFDVVITMSRFKAETELPNDTANFIIREVNKKWIPKIIDNECCCVVFSTDDEEQRVKLKILSSMTSPGHATELLWEKFSNIQGINDMQVTELNLEIFSKWLETGNSKDALS